MSVLLLFPAIRQLTQQCQSLFVFTVRPHPESDLLLSLFVHMSLYLPHGAQTLLLFQRPVCFKRHGPSHGIVSGPTSTFVIVCCSSCVVNMGNKKLNYGSLFAMFTCEELRAFDLPAPFSLVREHRGGRECPA